VSRVDKIQGILFVIAVPLFLAAISVTWAVNNPGVYDRGFDKYSISITTGIADDDLRQIGADIRHYFNSSDEPLQVQSSIFGVEQEIFNKREVRHMQDVKRLIQDVYLLALGSGAYLLVMVAIGLLSRKRYFGLTLARLCLCGGSITLGLVFSIGLLAIVGFDKLFQWFHELSFSNDYWQLDSRTDYLIRMFPEDFWLDATILVATLAACGAVTLMVISSSYIISHRWTDRVNKKPASANIEGITQG
jgi:integral membrane protein (TIGR01906 family)